MKQKNFVLIMLRSKLITDTLKLYFCGGNLTLINSFDMTCSWSVSQLVNPRVNWSIRKCHNCKLMNFFSFQKEFADCVEAMQDKDVLITKVHVHSRAAHLNK